MPEVLTPTARFDAHIRAFENPDELQHDPSFGYLLNHFGYTLPDNQRQAAVLAERLFTDPHERAAYMRSAHSDACDIQAALAQGGHPAYLDALTGLANRFGMTEWARRHRIEDGDALLEIDLKNFKEVNDTLGQRVGDTVLRVTADSLQALFSDICAQMQRTVADEDTRALPAFMQRAAGVVGRPGGDEFTVVLKSICLASFFGNSYKYIGPEELGEQLVLAAMQRHMYIWPNGDVAQVTSLMSPPRRARPSLIVGYWAGVAVAGPGDTLDTLRHRADTDLKERRRQHERQGKGLGRAALARLAQGETTLAGIPVGKIFGGALRKSASYMHDLADDIHPPLRRR